VFAESFPDVLHQTFRKTGYFPKEIDIMTGLARRHPFSELTSLQRRMDQLFNEFSPFPGFDLLEPVSLSASSFVPRTDIYEENDRLLLDMEIPGLRPEDFKLTIEGNTLTISGERKAEAEKKEGQYHRVERAYGSFSRSFTLPSTVDPNNIRAAYENGILHLTMLKRADARPRQIKVVGETKQLPAKAA